MLGVSIALFTTPRRWRVICLAKSRNGPKWYHVCWPRVTAKRIAPVVSISWASCSSRQHYIDFPVVHYSTSYVEQCNFEFSAYITLLVDQNMMLSRLMFVAQLDCRPSQWLKWFCEAGGTHLTKPGWSKPNTHSNPTNLALFRHKITLYRFNQGGSYYCRGGGSNGSRGAEPPSPLTLTTGPADCCSVGLSPRWPYRYVIRLMQFSFMYVDRCQWQMKEAKILTLNNIHIPYVSKRPFIIF